MWIKRKKSSKIREIAQKFPILIVSGARQVGKSALIKNIFSDYHYISLDLPSDIAFAENNPEEFLKNIRNQ